MKICKNLFFSVFVAMASFLRKWPFEIRKNREKSIHFCGHNFDDLFFYKKGKRWIIFVFELIKSLLIGKQADSLFQIFISMVE